MVDDFDAYRKWLGIPPKEQPPHYYRLLGIAPFEDDADVIQNAADRQMAHIRTFQTGKHGSKSQKLLNELSVARGCLLDRERKSDYDSQLRLKLNGENGSREEKPEAGPLSAAHPPPPKPASLAGPPRVIRPPAPPPGIPVAPAAAEVAVDDAYDNGDTADAAPDIAMPTPSARRSSRRTQQDTTMPLIIGGAAVGVVILLGLIFLATREKAAPDDSPKAADVPKKPEVKPPAAVANVPPKPARVDPPRPRDVRPETRPESRPDSSRPSSETANSNLPSSPKFTEPTAGELPGPGSFGGDRVSAELYAARAAMGRRAMEEAKHHVIEAEFAAKDDAAKQKVAHVNALRAYLEEFWAAVRQGVFKMKAGESVRALTGFQVEFVKVEGETVTYKTDGSEQTHRITALRTSAATVFARKELGESDRAQYCVVAFLLLDRYNAGGGRSGRNSQFQDRLTRAARQLYEQVSRRGQGDPVLAKEIKGGSDLPALDISNTPPPNANSSDSLPDLVPFDGAMPEEEDFAPAPVVDKRTPVPDDKSQGEARKRMIAKFSAAAERARTPEQKLNFAKQLRTEAAGAASEPAFQFVLLEKARDLVMDAVKPELIVETVDELGKTFAIDTFKEKSVALNKCFLANNGLEPATAIHTVAYSLFHDALTAKRYDAAEMLGDLAQRTARKANDQAAVKLVGEQIISVKKLAAEVARMEQTLAKLKADPADAAANTFAGRHYCFVDENWRLGLPLLAKGTNSELKDAAVADMANPAAASEQAALADRWFKLGRATTDDTRAPLLRRAKHWFERALPQLSGAERTVAEERLKEIESLAPLAKF